jgi:hypothetical protein
MKMGIFILINLTRMTISQIRHLFKLDLKIPPSQTS